MPVISWYTSPFVLVTSTSPFFDYALYIYISNYIPRVVFFVDPHIFVPNLAIPIRFSKVVTNILRLASRRWPSGDFMAKLENDHENPWLVTFSSMVYHLCHGFHSITVIGSYSRCRQKIGGDRLLRSLSGLCGGTRHHQRQGWSWKNQPFQAFQPWCHRELGVKKWVR